MPRRGRRKGVAFSPQDTPKIRCNEWAGAQVRTQRTLVGVPLTSFTTSQGTFTSSCWSSQSRFTEPFNGGRSPSKSAECRNGDTVASSLTTSGTPGLGCTSAKRQKGQLQEKRGAKGSSESDTMGSQGEESARCQSPPLTIFSTSCVEAQEPFGQVPRGSGECMWPESLKSNRVDCASTSSVSTDSASLVSPCFKVLLDMCSICGLARKTLCCSSLAGVSQSLITGDRQTTTRSTAYPFFFLVSKVLEPVDVNKDGTRSSMVPTSSNLNDWLLLVVTSLNWEHGAGLGARDPSVYHGPPSQQCAGRSSGSACGRDQSLLPPMWRTNGGGGLGAQTASSHRCLRRS